MKELTEFEKFLNSLNSSSDTIWALPLIEAVGLSAHTAQGLSHVAGIRFYP
jgi:hypothetical protein